ncbi:MBL fold metallo-hydrolase [Altibacter sp. HG106]|uniref:MBL fold metallo-hydrolase n=1 Tax=Altibacter sp. HG106 TaxID=3023937 RepID=UPI0023506C7C|nr:MBL fold metallo-hydrolase [Altibacter sp. HG106]MDC7994651.1 MBL fold metallo-hydrolase [Altibacter sp. HG106]
MRLITLFLTAFLCIQGQVFSQDATLQLTQVQDSIYMLQGRGGNIAFQVGSEGTLMVDSQFANATPQILNKILSVTTQPLRYLVNTHHHGDHTGGNDNIKGQGAIVIAHENVRKLLFAEATKKLDKVAEDTYNNAMKRLGDETNPEYQKLAKQEAEIARDKEEESVMKMVQNLPAITFSRDMTFYHNGDEILAFHVDNAHTRGDIILYFSEANVMHTGDAFINSGYPFIDTDNGGSLDGYIKGLTRISLIANKDTKIIPGHGELAEKEDVEYLKSALEFLRDRVAYHVVAGKTDAEILQMKELTAEYDAKGFGDGFISTEKILQVIIADARRKYPAAGKK